MSQMKSIAFQVALHEVNSRFITTAPEQQSTYKLFCQIELGWWYYEDFYADKYDDLPHFSKLRQFGEILFQNSSLLSHLQDQYNELYNEFSAQRDKTPVAGCLLLNSSMTKVVLVCSWNGTKWGFPKGKIEEGEDPLPAAIREVDEETGFDASGHVNPEDFIQEQMGSKTLTLYIATNVPENTKFEPKTRKEISKIQFFSINEIPKSAYKSMNIITELKKWIKKSKPSGASPVRNINKVKTVLTSASSSVVVEQSEASLFNQRNEITFAGVSECGWTADEMFTANTDLTGKSFGTYDGNPQNFGANHPRFVNFLEKDTEPNNKDKAPLRKRMKEVRDKHGEERSENVPLPFTITGRLEESIVAPGKFFPTKFVLDRESVLLDMDRVLLRVMRDRK